MSLETVKDYLKSVGAEEEVIVLENSSATVAEAAAALGCEAERIAKTLSFDTLDGAIMIVASGDAKVDNKKFKAEFGEKAKMIAFDEVEEKTGHAPGGVCPFAVKEGVRVFLDVSLKRFETVFPAAGDAHSAVEMTADSLEKYSKPEKWVDVCKLPR